MIVTETTTYQEQFDRALEDSSPQQPEWLMNQRRDGFDRFNQLGFPTTKLEDWRFTNVAAIAKTSFVIAADSRTEHALAAIAEAGLGDDTYRLVFINGQLATDLSSLAELPEGVVVQSLGNFIAARGAVCEAYFGKAIRTEPSSFGSLNTGLFRDGAAIHVADGVKLDKPVHLIFFTDSSGDAVSVFPRNLVVVGDESGLQLIESHIGSAGQAYLADGVTEIFLGRSAEVDHYKLQSDSIAAYHVATTHVVQAASSHYRNHYFAFGGAISRNEINCFHTGEHVETILNGLYMVSGNQLADCRTRIDHAMPNCESHEMYKGILDNSARGVFNGKIHVHPDAQKTDAKQSNQALLLSDDAVIDTKPELEIYADDVRCTHGATVGELDETALFYLRSRGVPVDLARKILIFAFANDVVQGLNVEPLKKHLESVLLADHGLPYV
jgi:Fe-S cluster assembly protein SufD